MKRQGDILFIKVDKINPDFTKVVENNHIAEGEVTGHYHKLESGQVLQHKSGSQQDSALAYLKVDEPTKVTHQEHNEIPLESGIYEVKQQREFDGKYTNFVRD